MKFIEDVISGKINIGNYARLAVERHLHDLQVNDWEFYFSEEKAVRDHRLPIERKAEA